MSTNFFRLLSFIFLALLAGMMLMLTIVFFMNPSENLDFNLENPLLIIMLAAMIVGVFGSNSLYDWFKNKIENNDSIGAR